MSLFIQDITYGARQLRRNPLLTLTAVLTLAISIGANTTVFTVANSLLFRDPVGVADPGRLIDIGVSFNGVGFASGSYLNYVDISRRATTLDGVYAHPRFPQPMSLQDVERVFATEVSVNYFTVLGAIPAAGRLLDLNDNTQDVAVLSHSFWSRRFNKDPAVIGQALRLNGRPFTVVGVAAEGFQGTGVRAPELWRPLRANENRAGASLVMGARLKPGVPVAQAAAELDTIGRALQLEYPAENRDRGLVAAALSPMPGETLPAIVFLTLLTGVVFVILAIACANISGVLLARAAARGREIAVRLAIGAGRARIVRQLLTETILLFVISAISGVVLARWMTSVLISQLPSLPFPVNVSLALDARVLIGTTTLSLFAAVLSGLMPALQASKNDVASALKDAAQPAFGRLRLRHAFVVAQVALSLLLVVVAGLFVRALQHVSSSDPGFDASGIELTSVDFSMAGYTDKTTPAFARELLDRIRRLPNVEAATVAAVFPGGFEGIGLGGLSVAGVAAPDAELLSSAVWNIVEPSYFATLRMPLVAGRDFSPADAGGAPPVVILGEGAALRFWPGQNAVGQYIQLHGYGPDGSLTLMKTMQVIGVARDPKFGSLVDGTTGIYAYVPLQQHFLTSRMMIAARATNGRRLNAEMAALLTAEAPNLPILNSQTAEDYAALGLVPQRVVASVAGSLGIVGLLLAGIGIYGVTAHMVTRRTKEIGIRVALGAQRRNVIGMVLRQGMSLVGSGAVLGLILAAGISQLLGVFLFGIPPLQPIVFSAAAALFAGIGLVACYIPARRATRIEPMKALRNE
jgi:predicted permease